MVTALPLASVPASDRFGGGLVSGRNDPVGDGSVIVIVLGIGQSPDAPLLPQAMVNTFETYKVEVCEL